MHWRSIAALPVFLAVGLGAQTPAGSAQEHARKAQAALAANNPQQAIAEYRTILAQDPRNLDAHANLGVVYFFATDFSHAVEELKAALQIQPNIPKLDALLGMSEKRLGQTHAAQSDLSRAFGGLTEEKLRVDTGLELIEADYALNDLAEAAEVVNVLRKLRPTDADILYTAHRIYADLADETTLALALADPHSARMDQMMAHELARRADRSGAIAHYEAALRLEAHRADLHYELAEMLYGSSSPADWDAAEKEYQAALADNPYDEKSVSRLGDLALKRSQNQRALDYFSRAYQLQPNDPDVNLGLARVLMSSHEPAKAEPYLQRAVQIEPYNATAHYRLGVVYRELAKPAAAREQMAEFEKLKKMKSDLRDFYEAMRLQPGREEAADGSATR